MGKKSALAAVATSVLLVFSGGCTEVGLHTGTTTRPKLCMAEENIYGTNIPKSECKPFDDFFSALMKERGYGSLKILDSSEVTERVLSKRVCSDKILVERIVARITNENGDAVVLNTDSYNNYIKYDDNLEFSKGDVMVTYLMYNPKTSYTDDIIERYDFLFLEKESK